ncbi:hypothetical protein JTY60_02630 [symbiont of Argiope bruennichi]|uniref:hypothetical protein n=1 Tax=symbiont of Argiope bruennichi TaxID=2810479 RepID=UPI003DA44386
MNNKKEKILLDLSGKESIFDNEKNLGWGGISPERIINLGLEFISSVEHAANFDYISANHHNYLKMSSYFNSSHIANYHWYNEHMNGSFNNEDFYLPDWNF